MGHSTWSILTNVDKVHAGRPSHGEGGMPEAEIWWNVSALPVTWFRQFLPIDIATQYRGRLIVGVRSTARSESNILWGLDVLIGSDSVSWSGHVVVLSSWTE
jgi:hypothetical protein